MIQTHDQLFKKVMTRLSEVKRLLQYFIPHNIREVIDVETLELQSNSLLDDHLREYFSDVVYRCKLVGDKDAKICFLFEHKSYPDKHLLLQVLYYMAAIYRKQVEEKRLEIIVPIIFVHGKREFKIKEMRDIFEPPTDEFLKYLPSYFYELIDVNKMTKAQLEQVSSTFLLSMLLAFRSKGDKKLLLTYIHEMFKFVEEINSKHLRESLISALATYLFHYFNLNDSDMVVIRDSLPSAAGQPFNNTIERLMREGLLKGISKGRKQGLEEGREEGREQGLEEGREEGLKVGEKVGQTIKNIEKNIETTVNLLLEFPDIKDAKIAKIAMVNIDFVHAIRRTFNQRLIKKRREHFYKFYATVENFDENHKRQATELFEQLRKKIKKSKVKIAPPPKKKK